jgi:hypothetical protein
VRTLLPDCLLRLLSWQREREASPWGELLQHRPVYRDLVGVAHVLSSAEAALALKRTRTLSTRSVRSRKGCLVIAFAAP